MRGIFFLLVGLFFMGGCGSLLLVGSGVVTGYTLSNDSAMSNVESEYRPLWNLSLHVLEDMEGRVLKVNESKGIIKANVSGNNVTIKIDSITVNTQRLKVSSRKYFLPNPQFAQKVFFRIMRNLDSSGL